MQAKPSSSPSLGLQSGDQCCKSQTVLPSYLGVYSDSTRCGVRWDFDLSLTVYVREQVGRACSIISHIRLGDLP